jgi:hypothetical protein
MWLAGAVSLLVMQIRPLGATRERKDPLSPSNRVSPPISSISPEDTRDWLMPRAILRLSGATLETWEAQE